MKLLLLSLLLMFLIFPSNLIAQCKIKIDEFKNDTLIENKADRVSYSMFKSGCHALRVSINYDINNNFYFLSLESCHGSVRSVDKGDTAYIKLINEKLIRLPIERYSIADFLVGSAQTNWYLYNLFYIKDEDIKDIYNIGIKKINIANDVYELKKSGNEDLIDQIDCINKTKLKIYKK